MNKITTYPFVVSAGLFGMVAFIAALLYSLILGANLTYSDDPYIIGFFLACVNALAALVYFVLKEVKLKWFKPTISVVIYYCLLTIYFLFIEYIGGEASGYGYFFLTAMVLSLPILLIFIIYSSSRRTVYAGILSGLIYFIGHAYVLSGRI